MKDIKFRKYIKVVALCFSILLILLTASRGFINSGEAISATNNVTIKSFGVSYLSFMQNKNEYIYSNGMFIYSLFLLIICMILKKETKVQMKFMGTFIVMSALSYLYMFYLYASIKKMDAFILVVDKFNITCNSTSFTLIPLYLIIIIYIIVMMIILYRNKNKQD
ncbi:MAG: hypothetical protein RR543_02265 [Erysipelotrichales bacterium]